MDVQKHFEEKLIRRVARHAAFIRAHGRYPATLDALWPTLAMLLFFGAIEIIFWLAGWSEGHRVNLLINIIVVITLASVNIRALFFNRIRTGLSLGEGAQQLQVALAAAGFSLEWTEERDTAVLFALRGRGTATERHAIVFIPADGHVWYNVHDPRGQRFFVTDRRPLRNLIRQVEDALGLKIDKT